MANMDATSTSSHEAPDPTSQVAAVVGTADVVSPLGQLTSTEYRLLVEHSPVMIWRSDRDKKCDYFNRVWLEFTGRTMAQEAGDGWAEGVHPEDLQRCFTIYTSSFDQRRPFEIEYPMRRHDGGERGNFGSGRAWGDGCGGFIGHIS